MPKIFTTTTGIFPKVTSDTRSKDSGQESCPNLRSNLHKLDQGKINADELEDIIKANIKRAVTEQVEAGIDLPTDGLIRWTDLFSPFVQAWDGITRRGIHRFYDTNTLYGEPVIEGELKYNASKALEDFKFAKSINENTKAVLPGVFTFSEACVDDFYQDKAKLREVMASNLLEEAKAYIAAGAKYIEIHEPELGQDTGHRIQDTDVLEMYKPFGTLDAKVVVISYFKNFGNETARALIEAGVGIGIDIQKPHDHDFPKEGIILQAGIVDSRETKMESAELLAGYKEKITSIFAEAKEIIFSTSSHVEYLPHDRALQKISLLKNLKS